MYYNRFKVLDIYKEVICEASNGNIKKLRFYFDKKFLNSVGKEFEQLSNDQKNKLNEYVNKNIEFLSNKVKLVTTNQEYENWVINLFTSGKILEEDFEKIKEALDLFDKVRRSSNFPSDKSNIMLYKNYSELYKFVKGFNKGKVNASGIDYGNNEILFKDNDVDVVKIVNFEDGESLLQDSGWCVKHEKHFDNYAPPYYLIVDNGIEKGEKRIALINYSSSQIKDINDDAVTNDYHYGEYLYELMLKIMEVEKIDKSCLYSGDIANLYIDFIKSDDEAVKFFTGYEETDSESFSSESTFKIFAKLYNISNGKISLGELSDKISYCYRFSRSERDFIRSLNNHLIDKIKSDDIRYSNDPYEIINFVSPLGGNREEYTCLMNIFNKIKGEERFSKTSNVEANDMINYIVNKNVFANIQENNYKSDEGPDNFIIRCPYIKPIESGRSRIVGWLFDVIKMHHYYSNDVENNDDVIEEVRKLFEEYLFVDEDGDENDEL